MQLPLVGVGGSTVLQAGVQPLVVSMPLGHDMSPEEFTEQGYMPLPLTHPVFVPGVPPNLYVAPVMRSM
jgi:hypothetical protein